MGRSIVVQPDGLYAVFSSIIDDFVYTDCTKDDIKQLYAEEAVENSNHQVDSMFMRYEKWGFPETYEECIKTRDMIHILRENEDV